MREFEQKTESFYDFNDAMLWLSVELDVWMSQYEYTLENAGINFMDGEWRAAIAVSKP